MRRVKMITCFFGCVCQTPLPTNCPLDGTFQIGGSDCRRVRSGEMSAVQTVWGLVMAMHREKSTSGVVVKRDQGVTVFGFLTSSSSQVLVLIFFVAHCIVRTGTCQPHSHCYNRLIWRDFSFFIFFTTLETVQMFWSCPHYLTYLSSPCSPWSICASSLVHLEITTLSY